MLRLILAATLAAATATQPRADEAATRPAEAATRPTTRPREAAKPQDIKGVANFAQVSDGVYRGAQPTAEGFAELKKRGVKTVLSLRSLHSDRAMLKGLGLQYARVDCQAWEPEDEELAEVLKIIADPANRPVFIHCLHGADRTGLAVAAYRVTEQGWTPEEAATELPNFGFHTVFRQITDYLKAFDAEAMRKRVEKLEPPEVEVVK